MPVIFPIAEPVETFHQKYLKAKQAFLEGGSPQSPAGSPFADMPLTPEGAQYNAGIGQKIATMLFEGILGGEPGSPEMLQSGAMGMSGMIIGPQVIPPESLTLGQWGRVSKKVKAAGYDVRGGKDVKEIYERLAPKEALPIEYTQAIDAVVGGLPYALDEGGRAIEQKAIKEFGITSNPKGGGYLLRNGRMLDFSGGYGGQYGRGMDHRSIWQALPEGGEGGWKGIVDFGKETGAARMHWDPSGTEDFFDFFSKPSRQQMQSMKNMVSNTREFKVEFHTPSGESISTIIAKGRTGIKKVEKEVQRLFPEGQYYATQPR